MKTLKSYLINESKDDSKVIIWAISTMGGGHMYKEPIDNLVNWLKTIYKNDRKYIGHLFVYIPEEYVNKDYHQYLEKHFDKIHCPNYKEWSDNVYFWNGTQIFPNKKYIRLKGSSLDDMANDNCSIYFERKENKGFKLSEIIKQ